jgi:hypothetical protein
MLCPCLVAPAQPAPRHRTGLLLAWVLLTSGCAISLGPSSNNGSSSNYPPASIYEIDPEFAGEWLGDIDGQVGTLRIGELDERTFFGSFLTHDGGVEYTLLIEQTYLDTDDGVEVPSNRTIFTWQNGLGSRGKGWLLINREDTALTGTFGYGVATTGLGGWSFERVDG